MKQKILIRVTMTDNKTRARAMNEAVQFTGVTAAEIKGDFRNQIEVTGDEVNMICLIKRLKKKVAFAELVSVTKVEPPKEPEKEKEKEKKKEPEPCCPCPHGCGVPWSFPCMCHQNNFMGQPFCNHGCNCPFMCNGF